MLSCSVGFSVEEKVPLGDSLSCTFLWQSWRRGFSVCSTWLCSFHLLSVPVVWPGTVVGSVVRVHLVGPVVPCRPIASVIRVALVCMVIHLTLCVIVILVPGHNVSPFLLCHICSMSYGAWGSRTLLGKLPFQALTFLESWYAPDHLKSSRQEERERGRKSSIFRLLSSRVVSVEAEAVPFHCFRSPFRLRVTPSPMMYTEDIPLPPLSCWRKVSTSALLKISSLSPIACV